MNASGFSGGGSLSMTETVTLVYCIGLRGEHFWLEAAVLLRSTRPWPPARQKNTARGEGKADPRGRAQQCTRVASALHAGSQRHTSKNPKRGGRQNHRYEGLRILVPDETPYVTYPGDTWMRGG
jgi:hypothetical protein